MGGSIVECHVRGKDWIGDTVAWLLDMGSPASIYWLSFVYCLFI